MKFYSAIYLKDGCISLKPFDTNEEAVAYNKKVLADSHWGPRTQKTRVVTRRVNLN